MARQTQKRSTIAARRADHILEASARLFCVRGFRATSMRDIAEEVDMLPGSIYYHFSSKEAIFEKVYERGVARITERVVSAIASFDDPWDKLEAACIAHLEMLLQKSDYARVIVRVVPSDVPELSGRLESLRDDYEAIFRELTTALNLPKSVNKRYFRLQLLGSLNYAQTWYKPDGDAPKSIARAFVRNLRDGALK